MARLGFAVLAVVALAGCGLSEADVSNETIGDDVAAQTDELGAGSRTYVTLRKDTRRCFAPLCGGYFVADVNRATVSEKYVSGLDFTTAGVRFDDATIARVTEAADGEVVLYGKLGALETQFQTRKFVVSAAWRGMPGVKVAAGDLFYSADSLTIQCFAAPCPSLKAKKLNSSSTTDAHGLSVARASKPGVDQSWLTSRVQAHGALVAARFSSGKVYAAGTEKIVDASQVFVKLPESIGPCPMLPIHQCPAGQVHTGGRTADRCVMLTACVMPAMCPRVATPACADGYTLSSWASGAGACPTFACDPTWAMN